MREIDSIRLLFEGSEASDWIPVKNIGRLDIKELHREYHRFSKDYAGEFLRADNIRIVLYRDANVRMYYTRRRTDKLFKRIRRCPDIMCIKLRFKDGTAEDIHPAWEKGDEMTNSFQSSKLDKNRNLKIRIKRQK